MKSGSPGLGRTLGRVKRNGGLYLLLLPAFVLTLLFAYKPMYGVLIAFKDYSPALGIGDSPWAGFKHFEKFFNSYQFFHDDQKHNCDQPVQHRHVSYSDRAGLDG
ncbi:hypothetical protein HMSSN036_19340 [Paenibacillus macerans]|nr:hypothetical protein HMSSN036_19340 [Paenibacillus macerans]